MASSIPLIEDPECLVGREDFCAGTAKRAFDCE
jgi:hypothetical protein